jgi:hypothetical protein
MEYVKGLFGKKEEPQQQPQSFFGQQQPQSFFGQQPGIMDRFKSMFAKGGKKPTKKPKKPKTKTKKNRK